MTDIDPRIETGAVKLYENEPADDFPVLKAFQQYIDAEQAKSRKRLMLLCVFFCFVMTVVIAVFVVLLLASSSRTQALNDRLVEYAMKDRERIPVAVQQSPVQQPTKDDSAIRTLTDKLDGLAAALVERSRSAEKTEKADGGKSKTSAEALEIERLKVLLSAEKEKAAAEREKQRQRELEEYRRKHYPELYGLKPVEQEKTTRKRRQDEEEADREIDSIVKEARAINYFNTDEEDDESEVKPIRAKPSVKKATPKKASPKKAAEEEAPEENDAKAPVEKATEEKKDAVPSGVGAKASSAVKDKAGNTWAIPLE